MNRSKEIKIFSVRLEGIKVLSSLFPLQAHRLRRNEFLVYQTLCIY